MTTNYPLPAHLIVAPSMEASPSLASTPAHLRWVTDDEGLEQLRTQWDALLERSVVSTPFMTWDWVQIWYDLHRHRARLCIAVVEDRRTREIKGIAPLMIAREESGPRVALRHLAFIGAIGEGASQGMDFIIARGDESQVAPLLCQAFWRMMMHWDVIDLQSMHEESPNLPFIKQSMARFVSFGERSPSQPSYLMRLPATWDEQLALWKSKERVAFRTKWRKLLDEHEGQLIQGGVDYPADLAFDDLWRLHSLRFAGEHSCFLNDTMQKLHRELVRRWSPTGRVMLPLLGADGKIVAARYGFAMGGKYWSYQTGYDPAVGKLSAGILSLGWTAQCAIARGLTEMDHLPGEARYKNEWSTHTRRVVHLEAFNPLSLTGAMFRGLRAFNRMRFGDEPTTFREVTS